MKTITRDQLRHKLDHGDSFSLIDVSSPEQFEAFHIPGSINVPLDDEFGQKVQLAVPDKSQTLVVYSRDAKSEAAPSAVRELASLGYSEVLEYEAGKVDWQSAGLKVIHS